MTRTGKSGRPTKFTPERAARICELIRSHNFKGTAAKASGISRQTLENWIKRGEQEKSGPYHDFVNDLNRALADAEASSIAGIALAGTGRPYKITRTVTKHVREVDANGVVTYKPVTETTVEEGVEHDWHALAWLRERMQPEKYGRKLQVAGAGSEDDPIGKIQLEFTPGVNKQGEPSGTTPDDVEEPPATDDQE